MTLSSSPSGLAFILSTKSLIELVLLLLRRGTPPSFSDARRNEGNDNEDEEDDNEEEDEEDDDDEDNEEDDDDEEGKMDEARVWMREGSERTAETRSKLRRRHSTERKRKTMDLTRDGSRDTFKQVNLMFRLESRGCSVFVPSTSSTPPATAS